MIVFICYYGIYLVLSYFCHILFGCIVLSMKTIKKWSLVNICLNPIPQQNFKPFTSSSFTSKIFSLPRIAKSSLSFHFLCLSIDNCIFCSCDRRRLWWVNFFGNVWDKTCTRTFTTRAGAFMHGSSWNFIHKLTIDHHIKFHQDIFAKQYWLFENINFQCIFHIF